MHKGAIVVECSSSSVPSLQLNISSSLPSRINKLKDEIIDEAKVYLEKLKNVKVENKKKRSDLNLEQIATSGLKTMTDGNGMMGGVGASLGTGADLFAGLFNVFNTQFIGKFFGMLTEQMKNQNLLSQLNQNGLMQRRRRDSSGGADSIDLDDLKKSFDLKLEETFKNGKEYKNLSADLVDKYLGVAKDFTHKLKDITVDLVNSIKFDLKKND